MLYTIFVFNCNSQSYASDVHKEICVCAKVNNNSVIIDRSKVTSDGIVVGELTLIKDDATRKSMHLYTETSVDESKPEIDRLLSRLEIRIEEQTVMTYYAASPENANGKWLSEFAIESAVDRRKRVDESNVVGSLTIYTMFGISYAYLYREKIDRKMIEIFNDALQECRREFAEIFAATNDDEEKKKSKLK